MDKIQSKHALIELCETNTIEIDITQVVGYITNAELIFCDDIYKIYVYYKAVKFNSFIDKNTHTIHLMTLGKYIIMSIIISLSNFM